MAQRLVDDHGVWAITLFDEVQALGHDRSYPTFTRKLRQRQLRPHCETCSGGKGRATVIIEHPSGEEFRWDCDELGTCPWDPTMEVSMLVGSLSHSSMSRAWLSYSQDQPHLVDAIDQVLLLSQLQRRVRLRRRAPPASGATNPDSSRGLGG